MNGLTATKNATVNCYPMIQISGSSVREPIDRDQGNFHRKPTNTTLPKALVKPRIV